MTKAMIDTGERIHFDTHPVMDKHSIGGVPGNKVSLLVVPIVAACGPSYPQDQFSCHYRRRWNSGPYGSTGTGGVQC